MNYGIDRLRFTWAVRSGAGVRLTEPLLAVTACGEGLSYTSVEQRSPRLGAGLRVVPPEPQNLAFRPA